MKVQININSPESRDFYFFGDNAIEIPKELCVFRPEEKRFRVKYFTDSTIFSDFESFMRRQQIGKHGEHCDIPEKTVECYTCQKSEYANEIC